MSKSQIGLPPNLSKDDAYVQGMYDGSKETMRRLYEEWEIRKKTRASQMADVGEVMDQIESMFKEFEF